MFDDYRKYESFDVLLNLLKSVKKSFILSQKQSFFRLKKHILSYDLFI